MPRSANSKGRHVSYNAHGQLCMTVVDPVTRKLLIPLQYILETRAQQRSTLPSLCQLFLQGRCRQGTSCYQVHADWEAVEQLRSQVDSLPCCCPAHGDKDHLACLQEGVLLSEALALPGRRAPHTLKESPPVLHESLEGLTSKAVVVAIPGCTSFEGGYIPVSRISFTTGLRHLLCEAAAAPAELVHLLDPETGFAAPRLVVRGAGLTICRLHAMDRCRYAEECKFLHLCRHVTALDPQLAQAEVSLGSYAEEASSLPSATGAASYDPTASFEASRRPPQASYGAGLPSSASSRVSVFASVSQWQQQGSLGLHGYAATAPPGVARQSPSFSQEPGSAGTSLSRLLVPQCDVPAPPKGMWPSESYSSVQNLTLSRTSPSTREESGLQSSGNEEEGSEGKSATPAPAPGNGLVVRMHGRILASAASSVELVSGGASSFPAGGAIQRVGGQRWQHNPYAMGSLEASDVVYAKPLASSHSP